MEGFVGIAFLAIAAGLVYAAVQYPQVALFIAAIVLLLRWHHLDQKKNRLRVEQQNREEQQQIQAQRAEEQREADRRRSTEKDRLVRNALLAGGDACQQCKTIRPLRCACGACIATYPCSAGFGPGTCESCHRKVRAAACRKAEALGHDVCGDCLTVQPDRCYCGNCVVCYGGSTSACSVCD